MKQDFGRKPAQLGSVLKQGVKLTKTFFLVNAAFYQPGGNNAAIKLQSQRLHNASDLNHVDYVLSSSIKHQFRLSKPVPELVDGP